MQKLAARSLRKNLKKPIKTVPIRPAARRFAALYGTAAMAERDSWKAHEILLARAESCSDLSGMTRYDSTMSRAEIIASVMRISIEEAELL